MVSPIALLGVGTLIAPCLGSLVPSGMTAIGSRPLGIAPVGSASPALRGLVQLPLLRTPMQEPRSSVIAEVKTRGRKCSEATKSRWRMAMRARRVEHERRKTQSKKDKVKFKERDEFLKEIAVKMREAKEQKLKEEGPPVPGPLNGYRYSRYFVGSRYERRQQQSRADKILFKERDEACWAFEAELAKKKLEARRAQSEEDRRLGPERQAAALERKKAKFEEATKQMALASYPGTDTGIGLVLCCAGAVLASVLAMQRRMAPVATEPMCA